MEQTVIEPGMTRAVRKSGEDGDLVTLFYDPFEAEGSDIKSRIADYMLHRADKPITGKSLCDYAAHCEKLGKQVDASAVGVSVDLLALHHHERLPVTGVNQSDDYHAKLAFVRLML